MTIPFSFPTSNDVDDAIYDVPLPGEGSTLAELEEFENIQNSDPLNVAFSLLNHFSSILAEFAPSIGRLMKQPEYQYNIDFQLKAMKLCFYGIGYKFISTHRDPMFHVTELVKEVETVDPGFFMDRLLKFFRNGDYLLTRSWYCCSPLRQLKTIVLAMTGFGKEFDALSGDFDYALNQVLRKAYRQINEDGYDPYVFLEAMDDVLEEING
jgi:hypothetical protein